MLLKLQKYKEHILIGIKVHGWVFDIHSGKLIDLKIDFNKELKDLMKIYKLEELIFLKITQLQALMISIFLTNYSVYF